jgi:hypothetical protein
MWQAGLKRVILVLPDLEFTRADEQSFKQTYPGTIVTTLTYPVMDLVQMQDIVLKLRKLDYDGIHIPLVEPFLNGIMTKMQHAGIRGKKVFSIFSVEMPEVLKAEGRNAEGLLYSFPDLPTNEEAAVYFARIATELLADAVVRCKGDSECVRQVLDQGGQFQEGVHKGPIVLKTVKNGHFTWISKQVSP